MKSHHLYSTGSSLAIVKAVLKTWPHANAGEEIKFIRVIIGQLHNLPCRQMTNDIIGTGSPLSLEFVDSSVMV